MLKNERGHYLQSHELLPRLGFKVGCHLPAEGFGPTEVDGVTFICEPAGAPRRNNFGRLVKSSKHRLFYLCSCRKWVPCGRAGQHKCKPMTDAQMEDLSNQYAISNGLGAVMPDGTRIEPTE